MVDELLDAIQKAGEEDSIRCLILTGDGQFFSTGQDLSVVAEEAGEISMRYHLPRTYNPIVLQLRRLEKPVVGAINGTAAGAGLGIALATDMRIAAKAATFIFGFTRIGLTADSGTSLTLPLLIGLARATEMAFTNRPLSAQEALDYGLVNQVVPLEELEETAWKLAASLAKGPTQAFGLTKAAFNKSLLATFEAALDYETQLQEIAGRTEDHREGVSAFVEKRPPRFTGK
jgi:2-(1,2-epoxy-1,2-dihydrophenyl)acetyl-CoA isomerase